MCIRDRFRAALEEKIWLCRYFHEHIQELGFEVGPFPELSIAIFRYVPTNIDANEFNQQIIEWIKQDGRIFFSSTTLNGIYWIRFAVLAFRTHLEQVDLALAKLKEAVQQLGR